MSDKKDEIVTNLSHSFGKKLNVDAPEFVPSFALSNKNNTSNTTTSINENNSNNSNTPIRQESQELSSNETSINEGDANKKSDPDSEVADEWDAVEEASDDDGNFFIE